MVSQDGEMRFTPPESESKTARREIKGRKRKFKSREEKKMKDLQNEVSGTGEK